MDYTRQMQKALDFIEARLKHHIELEDIADVANFSMFHFHRMFYSIVGFTPKSYIRQRRMSLAARELIFTKKSIVEIALCYQFDSQAAFTRAFKKQFGITPGKLRRSKSPFSFVASVNLKDKLAKGVNEMEVKIIEKEAMKVIGMDVVTTQKNNKIPQLWDNFNKRFHEIENIAVKNACLGVCPYVEMQDFNEDSEFRYIAGAIVKDFSKVPDGMVTYDMPAQKYAVVTHKGTLDKLQETYQYIYAEWLKNSEFEFCPSAEFEWYDERFKFGSEDSELDLYIPIR